MATGEKEEVIEAFTNFFRNYYRDDIAELAQRYPSEDRSMYVDFDDIYTFDPDLADDVLSKPQQLLDHAEEALRRYDLPTNVTLGQAHVRLRNLPETTEIRAIRADHVNRLVQISGIIRKATGVRPKITEAAFECQRCGTMNREPQSGGEFREPHECECERQGPFQINADQSEFVDAQRLQVQESPEGLRGGQTPEDIDVHVEDDITGEVTAGDHVAVTGILRLEQKSGGDASAVFDVHVDGLSVDIEEEQFEDMEITEADKQAILDLSTEDGIYDLMIDSMAPSIYGYEREKLSIVLQLFSGVTKELPDESRIRGDLHILLIGDPGTGKCQAYDTRVRLGDGVERPLGAIVEEHLTDPRPIDDGVYQPVEFPVRSIDAAGRLTTRQATKVWRREAPAELYRIETAGREIEVTPSHPLFVRGPDGPTPRRADALEPGVEVAVADRPVAADGGARVASATPPETVGWEPIASIERIPCDDEWVYDLEVAGTHAYVGEGIVSHNSQLLQYVRNIAPRSVYTSGKGSSSAGLTAAAVQEDFGDGQQWTLEAGALVLADRGIAAVDELDKMDSSDRSAMHEALEQQSISISKAGINATLKSRCALLGAANPKYGRFDQYEAIGEQIDLEPALISRFDLIFAISDDPEEEHDRRLAEHILTTNYAGELNTQRAELHSPDVTEDQVEAVTDEVEPAIDADLFRKYVAYAKQRCHPRMTEAAREAIQEFYVDLRVEGTGEDAPVPVTARKLEALVRLAEASARVRLSDTVEQADADRAIEIVRSCLEDIGVDPETGELDADIVETGTSKSQRDRIQTLKEVIEDVERDYDEGAPVDEIRERAEEIGVDPGNIEHEIEKMKQRGEVYEPSTGCLRTT
ncbi:AAA family ATPase [Halobacteriales archaeon SW_7_68_16]|nr:MAG: AAA family ATPase [Halobacteriales archaeon SW_7_68_16]